MFLSIKEKMVTYNIFLLLIVFAGMTYSQEFRLPDTQIPSMYNIQLNFSDNIFDGTASTFSGTVTVTFQTTVSTNIVKIHAPGPSKNVRIVDSTAPLTSIDIISNTYNYTTEILHLGFSDHLKVNSSYELIIEFDANVDVIDRRGVYRSTYKDELGLRYLIATQFQPTYARKAFPCFDEPKFKAEFTLSLTFPSVGYMALSNTYHGPKENSNESSVTVHFETTPKMSTYLLAFVISNFTCTWGSSIPNSISSMVCSRRDVQMSRYLANSNTATIMTVLHSLTNITYSDQGLRKLHQVAVPDFYAGAMENWGLVLYRESFLIWNEHESSNFDKQQVVTLISHELSHFWFGNLVTNDWWDDVFLNEGFASYFQYFIPASIASFETSENWQMVRQFVVEQVQTALGADGHFSAKALSSSVATPAEISGHFSVLSYRKGSSILRMIENFVSTPSFQEGIRKYLAERKFNTALPHHLWSSLQSTIQTNILPGDVTFSEVIENWIHKPGYPVIEVSTNGSNIHIKQKRFLYDYGANDNTQWYVPITYTIASDVSQFSNLSPKGWMIPGKDFVIPNILQNNDWIIFNNQESAYYRVNYDKDLWSKIQQQLTINHESIDVLNRAQIVDDVFNLARAGEISYNQAFLLITYMNRETEYFPWYSAIKGFDYLTNIYGDNSEIGSKFVELQLYLLQNVYHIANFSSLDASNQIHTLRLNLILNRLCRMGEMNCIFNAKKLYQDYRTGINVDKNLKSVVYCNGLRYSDDIKNDWTYLWNQLNATSLATEQREIIAALGCTKDTSYLNLYLEQAMDSSSVLRLQDFSSVWASVYSSSSYGLEVALDFFIKNHERISSYDSDAAKIISNIASRIFTRDQLTKIEGLFSSANLADSLQEVGSKVIAEVTANLDWSERRANEIKQYFTENPIPDTTYPTTPNLPTTITTPSTLTPITTTTAATNVTEATTVVTATTATAGTATAAGSTATAATSTAMNNSTAVPTDPTSPTTVTIPPTILTDPTTPTTVTVPPTVPTDPTTPTTATVPPTVPTDLTPSPNPDSLVGAGERKEIFVVILMLIVLLMYI